MLDVVDVVHVLVLEVEITEHVVDLLLVLVVQVVKVEHVRNDVIKVLSNIVHQVLIVQQRDPLECSSIVVESNHALDIVAPVVLVRVHVLGQEVVVVAVLGLDHGSEGDHGVVVPVVQVLRYSHNVVQVLGTNAPLDLVEVVHVVVVVPVATDLVQQLLGVAHGHLFVLESPLVVLGASLQDRLVEQTLGHGRHHVETDGGSSGSVTENGHLVAISAEMLNVVLNPLEHHMLILQAVVSGVLVVVHGEEAERSQTVVASDQDHIIVQQVVGTNELYVSVAHGEATAVHVEQNGQILHVVLVVLDVLWMRRRDEFSQSVRVNSIALYY